MIALNNQSKVIGQLASTDHMIERGEILLVNVDDVITWLKPIRDAGVQKLWKKYSFSHSVQVVLPPFRPHANDCTEENWGGEGGGGGAGGVAINFIY